MKDRVLTCERLGELSRVSNVALHNPQIGLVWEAAAEVKPIIYRNMIPLGKEARRQHMSNVTGSAGNQHIPHREIASVSGPILLQWLTEALKHQT